MVKPARRTGRLRRTVRHAWRSHATRVGRRHYRSTVRNLSVSRRQSKELYQALAAFSRAIRCHRRLAALAPRFFDSVVVEREAQEREEQRRWRETWEPALAKVYGTAPPCPPREDRSRDLPPLPGLSIQHEVDEELAGLTYWMAMGHLKLDCYARFRPHDIASLHQVARLIELASELGRLASGLALGRGKPRSIFPG